MKLIKFKIVDIAARKIIADSVSCLLTVDRLNDIHTVVLGLKDARILIFTGFRVGGVDVYDGDIVEAVVNTNRGSERVTDSVEWMEGAWRFGTFECLLSEVAMIAVRGNRHETPWPEQRLTV